MNSHAIEAETVAAAAQELLDELESSCLEVILVPQRIRTNEGGMVRVAVSKNVRWYRAFCAAYTARRFKKVRGKKVPCPRKNAAHDTAIKRAATLRALRAIAEGRPAGPVYGYRLMPLVEARAAKLGVQIAANPF